MWERLSLPDLIFELNVHRLAAQTWQGESRDKANEILESIKLCIEVKNVLGDS